MRTAFAGIALAAVALAAAQASAQQPDWSRIEIKAEKVAGNVYVLTGEGAFNGGNVGVAVGRDGVLLVDDKFEPLVPKIEAALRGITSQPVRFVLNTHYHGDHTHGNKVFGAKATIQGRTLDQLRADKVLAAFDARWGGGFMKTDVYLAQLFNSLKGIAKNPS